MREGGGGKGAVHVPPADGARRLPCFAARFGGSSIAFMSATTSLSMTVVTGRGGLPTVLLVLAGCGKAIDDAMTAPYIGSLSVGNDAMGDMLPGSKASSESFFRSAEPLRALHTLHRGGETTAFRPL